MKIRDVKTNQVSEVGDSYAMRLIEQGKAVLEEEKKKEPAKKPAKEPAKPNA